MAQYPLNFDIDDYADRPKQPMKRSTKLLIVGALLLVAFLTWNTHRLEDKRIEEARQNGTLVYYLPELAVKDFDKGSVHYVNEYFGDGVPVVLNLWASWCEPCVKELTAFYEAKQKYGDSVRFILVSIIDGQEETVESAKQFIEGTGYPFQFFYDDTGSITEAVGAKKIPMTFFLYDGAGYIATAAEGGIDTEITIEGIEKAFDKIYNRETEQSEDK